MDGQRLSRCAELEYILLGDLRDLLEETPNEVTAHWLAAVLDTLLNLIPEELSLKAEDGYLCEVLDDFPNWQGQVETLENEYYALCQQLHQLRKGLIENDYHHTASRLRVQLHDWMDAMKKHQIEERRLLMMAVNYEVGGGD